MPTRRRASRGTIVQPALRQLEPVPRHPGDHLHDEVVNGVEHDRIGEDPSRGLAPPSRPGRTARASATREGCARSREERTPRTEAFLDPLSLGGTIGQEITTGS